MGGWAPTEFNNVSFTFIRLLTDVDTRARPISLFRKDLSARGLQGFPDDTLSVNIAEPALVEKRLRETGERVARAYGQGRQPEGLEALGEISNDDPRHLSSC
jgi:hypothetical protein